MHVRLRPAAFGSSASAQSAVVTVPQPQVLASSWCSVITGAVTGGTDDLPPFGDRRCRTVQRAAAAPGGLRFDRHDLVGCVGQGMGHPGIAGLLAGLAT